MLLYALLLLTLNQQKKGPSSKQNLSLSVLTYGLLCVVAFFCNATFFFIKIELGDEEKAEFLDLFDVDRNGSLDKLEFADLFHSHNAGIEEEANDLPPA